MMARAAEAGGPGLIGFHYGIIQADGEEDQLVLPTFFPILWCRVSPRSGRKIVAHGASHGKISPHGARAPAGAKEITAPGNRAIVFFLGWHSRRAAIGSFAPLGLWRYSIELLTHSLRYGLPSVAPAGACLWFCLCFPWLAAWATICRRNGACVRS